MIDPIGLLFVLLIFAPFLFIIVPTLVCHKLTGKWWPKPEIVEGHGLTDVSCIHGSRWMWWDNELMCPEGQWNKVVIAPECDCADPPRPFKGAER